MIIFFNSFLKPNIIPRKLNSLKNHSIKKEINHVAFKFKHKVLSIM